MPKELENLLEIVRIKEMCRSLNIVKLAKKNGNYVFYFDSTKFDFGIIDKLIQEYKNNVSFSPGKEPYITLKSKANSEIGQLEEIKGFLKLGTEKILKI